MSKATALHARGPLGRRADLGRTLARLAPLAVGLAVSAPVFVLLASFFEGDGSVQAHIWTTTGPRYFAGTVLLCLAVAVATTVIGAGAAVLVSLYEFPGRRFLSAALTLPLAVPAYISAYAYADLLGPFGAAARFFGVEALPDIRTLPGAAFILTLSAYPYVYLALRASFTGRSAGLLEASRSLGASPMRAIWKTLLPAGRAALAGGLALAMMETAADFGVADYFGVQTLSVGIFRTWYGLGDLAAASQLAAGLFLIALALALIEHGARRGQGADAARDYRRARRLTLSPPMQIAALVFCVAPPLLGLAIPVATLLAKLQAPTAAGALFGLGAAAQNSAAVAAGGAACVLIIATMLVYSARRTRSPFQEIALRASTMGYALPGAVIAIGVLAFSGALNSALGFGLAGLALLVYAYVARFLTIGFNTVGGGIAQIHPLADDAARSLGAGPAAIVARVHWPIARGAFAAAALIVIVEIAKELPATLLLRPFNFETLATRVYRIASDERLAEAAPAALILIGLSLVPVIWLDAIGPSRPRSAPSRD